MKDDAIQTFDFSAKGNVRTRELLSGGWEFAKISDFTPAMVPEGLGYVEIPHNWNRNFMSTGENYLGKGLYRCRLEITQGADRRIFLRFQGVLAIAQVYLNGYFLGEHCGGYSAFIFEITDKISSGENLLEVVADNSFNPDVIPAEEALFSRFGGIYRPVELIGTSSRNISPLDRASSGVYVTQTALDEDSAELEIRTILSGSASPDDSWELMTELLSPDGEVLMSGRASLKPEDSETAQKISFGNPQLWDGRGKANLYGIRVRLMKNGLPVDEVRETIGLRRFHVHHRKGFFLNGRYLDLYGVGRHQEWKEEGSALSDEHHRADMELIYELGANAVRLSHYQQADTMYRLADEYGIVVWAEIPLVGPYQYGNSEFRKNSLQQLEELIKQNYNHPSIIFWGLFNEIDIPGDHLSDLHNLAKSLDPVRLTTAATNRDPEKKDRIPDLSGWNRYPHWYVKEPLSRSRFIARFTSLGLAVGISEYGAGGCVEHHSDNPEKPHPAKGKFFPEEYQSRAHELIWRDIRNMRSYWFKLIWNLSDFSWILADRGAGPYMNWKGLVTYDRKIPKDSFYFYKANWRSDVPVLRLTSSRFTKRTNPFSTVKAYSNADRVRLYANGKLISSRRTDSISRAQWKRVRLSPGENRIRVEMDWNGDIVADEAIWTLSAEGQSESNPF